MPRKHHPHPVARAGDRHRDEMTQFIQIAQTRLRAAWANADQQHVAGVRSAFVAAYSTEYERITKTLTDSTELEADDPTVVQQRLAQLRHWLLVSGWHLRLTHTYAAAARQAGQESQAAVQMAQRPALELGWNHARMLLIEAMQPAIKAGMPWRPKP